MNIKNSEVPGNVLSGCGGEPQFGEFADFFGINGIVQST